jgi:hypothetical protein
MKLYDLFEARDRDPDRDYDERRQQQLDDEVDKTLVTAHTVRVGNETVFGPTLDSTKAVAFKNDLNKKHPRPEGEHRDYASVYSYRTDPKNVK